MENTIEVKSLRKSFAGAKGAKTEVLRGVDFNVRKGEIFACLSMCLVAR
jgi:ABC-type multidrug transport system ATPase subunit